MSNNNQFFESVSKRRYRELPELAAYGLRCSIRSLTESEFNDWEFTLPDASDTDETRQQKLRRLRANFIRFTVVDSQTKELQFSESEIDKLTQADGRVIRFLFDAASDHCGLTPGELERIAKDPFTEDDADEH